MRCPVCKKNISEASLKCPYCKARTGLLCSRCNTVNPVGSLKCKNCGQELLKICSKCGSVNYPGTLKCRKCGAVYKPFEIAKKIEYNPQEQMILESRGKKMKIRISGGSFNGGKIEEIVTGDFQSPVKAIKSNKLNKKIEKKLEEEKKAKEAVKTVNGVAEPAKKEEPVEEKEPKETISPFSINEEDMGKGDLGYEADGDKEIEKILSELNNIYYREEDSDKRKKIIAAVSTYLLDLFADQIDETVKMIAKIFKKKSLSDAVIKEFLDNNSCSVNNQFLKLLLTSDNYYVSSEIEGLSVEDENILFDLTTSIFKSKSDKVVVTPESFNASIAINEILKNIGIDASDETLVAQESEIDFYDSGNAKGLELVKAEIVSKKDLFPSEKKGKIIAIKNDDGKYLTINNAIISIDKIDDRNVKDISIVPKDWYEEAQEIIDSVKKAPTGSLPEEEIIEQEASGEEE